MEIWRENTNWRNIMVSESVFWKLIWRVKFEFAFTITNSGLGIWDF